MSQTVKTSALVFSPDTGIPLRSLVVLDQPKERYHILHSLIPRLHYTKQPCYVAQPY